MSSLGSGKEDVLILKYTMGGELVWNKTWGGAGNDGQALLLKSTSPNKARNPTMTLISAAAIAVGLVIWMALILDIVTRQ